MVVPILQSLVLSTIQDLNVLVRLLLSDKRNLFQVLRNFAGTWTLGK